MKLIHCADLHLDARMTAFLSPEQAKERRGELLRTFLRMVDFAEENDVQAVLIAGDLFDRRQISAAARNTVLDAVRQHPAIVFFYVTGNHERDGFLQSLSEIPENLKLFGNRWRTYEAGGISITGADLCAGNRQKLMDSLVLDPEQFNIVMLHGQIAEYAVDNRAEIIDLPSLRNRNVDYLALGHIHTYRSEALAPRGIWCYPGCLEGRGFDECGEQGFVFLDIDTDARACRKHFVPFAFRRLLEVEADISGCLTTPEIAERVEEALAEITETGHTSPDLWKIILTGRVNVSCEKDPDLIRQRFAGRCYYLKVEDRTALEVDYLEFARDASLKGEFVRLVRQESTLDEQEKAEIIRCGIQALTGEELIL